MAKKKKANLVGLSLTGIAVVSALVAFFLMFAPSVGNDVGSFTGAQVAFGYSESKGPLNIEILRFSFMNFLPYLLILIGLAFSVLVLLSKLFFISKIVSAGCYIAAGVFFFCAAEFILPAGLENADIIAAFRDGLSLQAGAIVSGVFSFLAGFTAILTIFMKKWQTK